jgi:TatD DNase family protein
MAEKYPRGVYAAIGLHPIHLSSGIFKTKVDTEEIEFQTKEENFDCEKYKELAKSEKVVAIGEIGFDYWYRPKTKVKLAEFKNRQIETFLQQVKLAEELDLPIIFHCRVAHDELINILNTKYKILNTGLKGVMHCFTGTIDDAKKYLEMGFYIGFNGLIFKMDWWDEIIKKIPIEKILVETDCPYLVPPQAGSQRNEPIFVKYVAERIAELKDLNYEEVIEITTKNARELFKI